MSATNVSQFAQPKKRHGQHCVRDNVSSFTRALSLVFRQLVIQLVWYILKQLFTSVSLKVLDIYTSPLRGSVNIHHYNVLGSLSNDDGDAEDDRRQVKNELIFYQRNL